MANNARPNGAPTPAATVATVPLEIGEAVAAVLMRVLALAVTVLTIVEGAFVSFSPIMPEVRLLTIKRPLGMEKGALLPSVVKLQ